MEMKDTIEKKFKNAMENTQTDENNKKKDKELKH